MRWTTALAVVAAAGCGSSAVDMSLVIPSDQADFDLTCVTAVDVLPLGKGDAMPIELEARTDDFPCIKINTPVDKFTKLAAAMAGRVDVPLPASGLAAVVVRGRSGTCDESPASHEAVFYGGAAYPDGESELRVPLVKSISCAAGQQYTVKPVEMIKLFTGASPHTCTDYVDSTSQAFSGDIRPTLVPAQPMEFERGASTVAMTTATATVATFKETFKGTCAAIGLESADKSLVGQSCINGGVPTACGAGALELALVPADYAAAALDSAMTSKYSGATIVGVWSGTGTIGPLADAQVVFEDMMTDGKIVYGALGASGFTADPTGIATDATGGAIVYANGVVKIKVKAASKQLSLTVGAAPGKPSAIIAVIN